MFTKHIVMIEIIRLPVGIIVGLTTADQLRKREKKLEVIVHGECFYKVLQPVGFKRGEEILLDPAVKFNPKQVSEIRTEAVEEETTDITVKPEGPELIKAIRDAIFDLKDEDYTNDNIPKVDALTDSLGYTVIGEERNAGFAAYVDYVEQLKQSVEMIASDLGEGEIPTAEVVAEFFKDETITQELVDAIYKSTQETEEE